MTVAKGQGREKPVKIEQRKFWGPEWGPQAEQAALLTSPVYIGQARGGWWGREKKHKKRRQRAGSLSLSPSLSSFGSACPHALRMYFPLFSKYNSCNTELQHWSVRELWPAEGFNVCCFKFLLWQDRTEEIAHSPNNTNIKVNTGRNSLGYTGILYYL